ncbi:MAG TPA: hypothetical protein VIU11_02435 [Nakamurella sp.]
MLKKSLAAMAALGVALTLAACGSSGGSSSGTTTAADGTAATSAAGSATSAAAGGSAGADAELPPIDPAMLDGAVVGFAQVGSESGWRSANTDDIKRAAEENNVDLQFTSGRG